MTTAATAAGRTSSGATDGSVTLALEVWSPRDGSTTPLAFGVDLVVLGGYAARDPEELERHVEELRKIGIDAPDEIPAFWAMSRHLVTTGDSIQVQGTQTSGEIEYALLFHGGTVYVAATSDHTDRQLETYSIPRSKQLCSKVLSRRVVPLDDVRDGWDDGELYSDALGPDGQWLPYQRAGISAMLAPDDLVEACFGRGAVVPDGTILCSGTVSIVDGETRFAPAFRGGVRLAAGAVDLQVEYRVDVLPEQAELASLGGGA